jgi:hypothetical protein
MGKNCSEEADIKEIHSLSEAHVISLYPRQKTTSKTYYITQSPKSIIMSEATGPTPSRLDAPVWIEIPAADVAACKVHFVHSLCIFAVMSTLTTFQ